MTIIKNKKKIKNPNANAILSFKIQFPQCPTMKTSMLVTMVANNALFVSRYISGIQSKTMQVFTYFAK